MPTDPDGWYIQYPCNCVAGPNPERNTLPTRCRQHQDKGPVYRPFAWLWRIQSTVWWVEIKPGLLVRAK